MSLSVGIVGLPNVGKSTLFNALLKKQQAYVANFPFATVEPNVGIVPVPDARLGVLAKVVGTNVVKPASVKFVDIAGLIKGASQGEGLGNKFLAHIRETDAIVHVIRDFGDEQVIRQGVVSPKNDFETVKTELELADLETQERRAQKGSKEQEVSLQLLASKPFLVAVNVDEAQLKNSKELENKYTKLLEVEETQVVIISAKVEAELATLSEAEQREYLASLGVTEPGLERLVQKAFAVLGLMTYLTAGEKEVRAWTVRVGSTAPQAAGVIHTDFVKHFISAKVCSYQDFVQYGGYKGAAEQGKVRTEGRDYIVKDGDVIEFMIGQ